MKSDEYLISQLIDLSKKLGKVPSQRDVIKNNFQPHPDTYHRRFGSWNKALFAIFGKINRSGQTLNKIVYCKNCGKKFTKRNSQIKVTKNNFCSSSCSGKFNNLNKKTGFRRSKLEKWISENINKYFKSLHFVFNYRKEIGYELDIFIPKLKLAFEINGIVHYKPIYGKCKYNKIKNNDRIKKKKCNEKNIKLHIINVSKMNNFNIDNAQYFLNIIVDKILQYKNK